MTSFHELKARFLRRLFEEARQCRVDYDLLEFLLEANSVDGIFTSSSCSGRVMIVEAEKLYDKRGGFRKVFVWHTIPGMDVFLARLRECVSELENVWVLVREPIIHFNTLDLETALKILRIARDAGLKHSGIMSVSRNRVVVEVLADDRLDIPVKLWGEIVVPPTSWETIYRVSTATLARGKEKLRRFTELFRKEFCSLRKALSTE